MESYRLKEERLEEVRGMADDIEEHSWKGDCQNRPKQPSSKCNGNAQALGINQGCFVDQILLHIILGQFLRSSVLEVSWSKGDKLLSAPSQFHHHEAGLRVKGIPSHVVVAEELNVIDSAHAYRVFRPLVDVDVLAYARIASNAFAHATYGRKRFIVVDRSLTSLCIVENNHRQPNLLEFIDGDHVHSFVQLYVVELQSCVHPCHSKAELQLEDLLDFLDFLDH